MSPRLQETGFRASSWEALPTMKYQPKGRSKDLPYNFLYKPNIKDDIST